MYAFEYSTVFNFPPLFQKLDYLTDAITGHTRVYYNARVCVRLLAYVRVCVQMRLLARVCLCAFASMRACTRGRYAFLSTFVRVWVREHLRICVFPWVRNNARL